MAVTTNELDIEIKANSDGATPSLDKLISKLNELNTALNNLNTAKISQIGANAKGVRFNTGGSSGGGGSSNATMSKSATLLDILTKSSNRANGSMLSFRGTMFKLAATWGTFYAAMYPAIRLIKGLGKDVGSSMDYLETYNYFLVTMNKIGHDSGDEYAKSFWNQVTGLNEKMTGFKLGENGELFDTNAKSLTLDPELLMNFQARIGAVTNSVGLLGEASTSTQKALSMLASDYSSLKNENLESVMNNFSSGLIGQSRALYKYGIDITNATLKQYAYEHGVTQSVSSMTQAQKMELRLLAILDQSKVAWGDQANTISSVANQYRIMQQQLGNIARVMGNLFLPIVQKVIPYLNALLIALRRVFNLLGVKLYGDNWLSGLSDGVSKGNFSGLSEDVDDVTDSIDGATKAAKKFKQATMGWDELNIINPNTSSGSGSGSGGGGGFDLSDDIDKALEEYEKVWNEAFKNMNNKAEEMANKFMSYVEAKNWFGLGRWLSDGLANQLESIDWNRAYSGAKQFGTGLAQFLNGLISPRTFYDVGETIANSLNIALYFALDFNKTFDAKNLGKSIAKGINGFFENFDFTALAETLNTWVDNLEDAISSALANLNYGAIFKGLTDFLTHLDFDTIAVGIGLLTISGIKKILLSDAARKIIIKKVSEKIALESIPLTSALKVTGGVIFTIKGLTMIFDSMQNGDLMEGLWGSLLTTGGVALLSGGNLMIVVPTLFISIASVSFAWLQTPDAETGYKGLNKILGKIKFGKEATTFDGETIEIKVSLKEKIKQFNVDWQNTIYDAQKEFDQLKTNLKATWGELSLDIGIKIESIKDAFQIKWDELTNWWTIEVPQWLESNVKPWFSKDKWKEVGSGIKDGLSDKWSEFSDWWTNTGIPDWWDNNVVPIFSADNWTFDGIKEGLKKSFTAALNGVKSLWNSFAEWINENLTWKIDPVEIGGKKIFDGADIKLAHLPKFNIPQYAIGGFPEDGLFMANHNELVGQFSNGQTAVANNMQIIDGIKSGVAQAVREEIGNYLREIADNTSDTATNTHEIARKPVSGGMSDRDVAKANLRGQRSLGMQLRLT